MADLDIHVNRPSVIRCIVQVFVFKKYFKKIKNLIEWVRQKNQDIISWLGENANPEFGWLFQILYHEYHEKRMSTRVSFIWLSFFR